RLVRTCSDVRGFLEQNRGRRALGDERERLVLIDSNDDWENVAGLFLCGGVKFLAERHDFYAGRTERSGHRRRGGCLCLRNLEFDMCDYFFGHLGKYLVEC